MKAPGRRTLIAAGIAAYVIFLLARFPADLAVRWFAPDDVLVATPSGTLWNGRAEAVQFAATSTGPVEWRVRPLALFIGRVTADVTARLAGGGSVAGRVGVTPTGTVYLKDIAGVVPLSALAGAVPTSTFDGRIGLDLAEARIDDNWLVDATGTIDLVDLQLVAPFAETLGSYELAFAGAGADQLVGAFREVQARLGAEGQLVLHHDRRWEIEGLVSATAATSNELSRALALLGPRDAQGRYLLAMSGEL